MVTPGGPAPAMARSKSMMMEADLLHVEWLQECPEDLDVFIAQRHFEGAVDLILRGEALMQVKGILIGLLLCEVSLDF